MVKDVTKVVRTEITQASKFVFSLILVEAASLTTIYELEDGALAFRAEIRGRLVRGYIHWGPRETISGSKKHDTGNL